MAANGMKPITELRNKHLGMDIWVLAAGPSAGYIDPAFYQNKWVIGVNRMWKFAKVDYLVVKEYSYTVEPVEQGINVIMSRHHCGMLHYRHNTDLEQGWYFEHANNDIYSPDYSVIGSEDKIVVSFSTITSAMHVAAYMGAANIILVGHDCGLLDGMVNIDQYGGPGALTDKQYKDFLKHLEPQSIAVREKLKEAYGCRVYSLNPFINLGLEGHKYES